ncbi:MAG: hypothetical protein GXP49_13585 [Deltaproteobacteria bacterium]|nr:hypothetical protein [Deltaproteobacteria bacterium]
MSSQTFGKYERSILFFASLFIPAVLLAACNSTGNNTHTMDKDAAENNDADAAIDEGDDTVTPDQESLADQERTNQGDEIDAWADQVDRNESNNNWIGPDGGSVDRLRFVAFGDVRPPAIDQDDAYPSHVVNQIFRQLAVRNPQFVIGVGDWVFASDYNHAKTQMQFLLDAEKPYAHFVFHIMGNHECNGWTDSNCPEGDETGQVRAYYELLWNFSTKPYFRFDVQTSFGDAKFVITAPNAWNSAQEDWLRRTLNDPTPYTFILRHEPPDATRAPGVGPSETIIKSHKDNTLIIYGHVHHYEHLSTNEVISGNGGAPLSGPDSGHFFGYLLVEQLFDGNIQVSEYKEGSDELKDRFVLGPNGKAVN